jgi:hypothetical protein
MAPVREALRHLLAAHEPAPAVVLNSSWELVQANRGAGVFLGLLGTDPEALRPGTSMLKATFLPGGFRDALINGDELCASVWRRAQREAELVPALRSVLAELAPHAPRAASVAHTDAPMLLMRLKSRAGDLGFFSTFTTFGTPLDVTLASLRVEHLFPADEATRRALAHGP